TAAPPSKAEIDEICDEVSREFALSAREGEILELIARGYTTNSIATKLVISPYTVNTHIRHIYEKMQIHKRSELLNYLNLQRSDF
ncbi:MAG: helix-turn-helix transcriptional regulator, partial [Gordonibacter sp.]